MILPRALRRLLPAPARWRRRGDRNELGTRGEELAEDHLRRSGLRIVDRNVHLPMGEIDLLCEQPEPRTIVLVEVRTRRQSDAPGLPPEQTVRSVKQRRLAAAARYLRRANGWESIPVRIDVVAVELEPNGSAARIRHLVGAVATGR